jgi:hypothetical protein
LLPERSDNEVIKMDQRIGIEYVVTGHDAVISANKQLANSMTDIVNNIKTVSNELVTFTDSISSRVSGVLKSFKDFQGGSRGNISGLFSVNSRSLATATNRTAAFTDKLERLVQPAHNATAAINELTASVGKYNGAVASSGNLAPKLSRASTPGGLTHATDTMQPDRASRWSPYGMGSLGFMARWWGAYQLAHAAKVGATDVMFGRSREELATGLGDLSAVSFSPSQKKQTEMAGQMFSQRFWTTTTEQYVQAMSQTASAFSIGELGFEQLRKMNDSVLAFGMISKMKPEAASELMSQNLRAFLAFQDPTVSKTLEEGGVATVKGLGKRKDGKEIEPFTSDMGGIMERMAAQAAKAIEISSIWGSGIANTFRHSLPVMLNMGWNPAAALALAGTAKDLGFHAGQSGRGFKDMFTSFPTSMAKTALMGMGKWEDETKLRAAGDTEGARQAQLQNQMNMKLITPFMAQQMSTPEGMMKIMPIIGQLVKQAQSNGWRLIEDMGISKNFLPLIQAFEQQGAMDRFKSLFEKISGEGIDKEMYEKAAATLDDSGTAWQRVSGAMSNFFEALSDSEIAHKAAGWIDKSLKLNESAAEMRMTQAMKKMTAEGRSEKEKTDFIDNMHVGWKNKFGEQTADKMKYKALMDAGIPYVPGTIESPKDAFIKNISSRDNLDNLPWGFRHVSKLLTKGAYTLFPSLNMGNPDNPLPLNSSQSTSFPVSDEAKHLTGAHKKPLIAPSSAWMFSKKPTDGYLDSSKPSGYVKNESQTIEPVVIASTPQAKPETIQAVAEEGPGGNFSFKLYVGQREIRDIFVEMIEENRTRGYQSFGSDPMGFNTGVD